MFFTALLIRTVEIASNFVPSAGYLWWRSIQTSVTSVATKTEYKS